MPVNLIPSKKFSKLTIKESVKNLHQKKDLHIFEESTKTHIKTLHSRNASLPSLNTPPFQELQSKNKENDLKNSAFQNQLETLILPKNAYFNKIFEERNKINSGMKKLKDTLDLNCYFLRKKKKSFF